MLKFVIPLSIYYDKQYNKLRNCELLLIANIFQSNKSSNKLNINELTKIVIAIELSCYNRTLTESNELLIIQEWTNPKFEFLYRANVSRITKNLDYESEVNDNYLINQILNNNINIDNIANLSTIELCPIKSKNIIDKLYERSQQKLTFKTSSMYKCKNCGKKEVTMQEIMMRSLDEGTNFSLQCNWCSYRWIV